VGSLRRPSRLLAYQTPQALVVCPATRRIGTNRLDTALARERDP